MNDLREQRPLPSAEHRQTSGAGKEEGEEEEGEGEEEEEEAAGKAAVPPARDLVGVLGRRRAAEIGGKWETFF